MKVLHVNRYAWRNGGAEAYMFDVAESQRAAGHDVAIFGVGDTRNEPAEYARDFPVSVDRGGGVGLAGAVTQAKALGRMMWSPSSKSGLGSVIDQFAPDVVHLHNVYHDLSPSVVWAARDRGVATVMTAHDYKLVCPSQELLNHGSPCTACFAGKFWHATATRCRDDSLTGSIAVTAEAYLHKRLGSYSWVSAFICPSEFMERQLRAGGVDPALTTVLNNFVDPSKVGPARSGGGGFLYAGRLSEAKGVDVLVRAVGAVPAAQLTVAGRGPEEDRLRSLAESEAPGRVTFVGHVDRAAVLDLMRGSQAMVLPARWHENQPMSILEANLVALPVIGTAMGGIPELITSGVDGWVVRPNDPDALASVLREILSDRARADEFGRVARQRVLDRHNASDHVRALDLVYERARRDVSREGRR